MAVTGLYTPTATQKSTDAATEAAAAAAAAKAKQSQLEATSNQSTYTGADGYTYQTTTDPSKQSWEPGYTKTVRVNTKADDLSAQAKVDATAAAEAKNARLNSYDALIKQALSSAASTTPTVAGTSDASTAASEAAAYGTAKDQAAATASASMKALRAAMAARGISGSGVEGQLTANVLNTGQQTMGETARSLAETKATRAASVADRNYAGAITQRGQDLTAYTSKLGSLASLLSALNSSY